MAKRYIITTACTLCGTCVNECPFGAISMTSKGAVIDENKCRRCGKCFENCASEAIIEKEE